MTERDRHRRAYERCSEMGLPGDALSKGQNAPDRRAVHEGNEQPRHDGAPVASDQTGNENVAHETVDQATRANMIAVSREEPYRDSRSHVDGGQNAKRRGWIEM